MKLLSPARWMMALAATALAFAPGAVFADDMASAGRIVVISDDIHKSTTDVAHAEDGEGEGDAGAGAGSDGSGKSNNGHGNNLDGVDSSNPGQGKGGPNGAEDPSGGVDDEGKGGGASPSKGKKK